MISQRLQHIKPSPTLSLSAKAMDLKRQGIDVINLAVGEPDFPTPEHVCHAAKRGIDYGFTKYTAVGGMPELKKAIQRKFQRDNNLHYELDEIIVSTGGKQVIFNAFMASLDPKDEVLIPAPFWVSYPDMVSLCGATSKFIDCPESQGFLLEPEQLRQAITPQTKWLVINSPSNPTGCFYSYEKLKALADVLLDYPDILILSDDIYEYLVYDGERFHNIAEIENKLKSRTLIVNGVSKSHSMTGWRLGYGAGPQELIDAMVVVQSQVTSNACSISQIAAIEALNGDHDFLNNWKLSFQNRRNFLQKMLNQSKVLKCSVSSGTFYLYVNCSQLIGKQSPQGLIFETDIDVCDYLLEHACVALVPGSAFGLSPYFRMSYACDETILQEACSRMIQTLNWAIE